MLNLSPTKKRAMRSVCCIGLTVVAVVGSLCVSNYISASPRPMAGSPEGIAVRDGVRTLIDPTGTPTPTRTPVNQICPCGAVSQNGTCVPEDPSYVNVGQTVGNSDPRWAPRQVGPGWFDCSRQDAAGGAKVGGVCCDWKSSCNGTSITLSQEHDHKKYTATFDPSQQAAQYDGQLRFWSFNVPYGGKFASTFVCVENFVRIPPHGSNFVKDFSHFRSGAGSRGNSAEAIAVRQKQAIALLSRQFIGNVGKAAESCYACILARSDDGCFPPGVKILMGDGKTEKKVEEVSAGESVWNPVLKQPTEILRVTEGPEKKDLVLVHAGPLQLKVSDEHPILTEKGMKQAMSLVVGDMIKDGAGEWHRIDAITFEPPPFGLTVINFVLQRKGGAADGLLIADGMLVGDIIVQRELSARAKGKGIR